MRHAYCQWSILAVIVATLCSWQARAQVATATVPTGSATLSVAVNPATNAVYFGNYCGTDPYCQNNGSLTVLNGTSLTTQNILVGIHPVYVAVNPVTNKIYVLNNCGAAYGCQGNGTVTVIDGTTLATQNVQVGWSPFILAINTTTNKIYVANGCGSDSSCQSAGTVTVIDGATLATQSVAVGFSPYGVAVNESTNTIYVANTCGTDTNCTDTGTLSVIDGTSLGVQSVGVDYSPYDIAVNPGTNKIYVDNYCGTDANCGSAGTLTVVDGSTLGTQRVAVGVAPYAIRLNATTNKIYDVNYCGNDTRCNSAGTVTVLDGGTLSTSTVLVGAFPNDATINATTNQIFVTNGCGNDVTCASSGTVTAIDGASGSTLPVAVGGAPYAIAMNAATNTAYVANSGDGTGSVIGGATTLQLVNLTPCRLIDTRGSGGPISADSFRTFDVRRLAQASGCGDLSTAASYALNVTLLPTQGPVGYLTIWPANQAQPAVSTMNSDGRNKANAAIVSAGVSGGVSVYVANTANIILDINGYFAPSTQSTLAFYPLAPCRVADTRGPVGDLGGPSLSAGAARSFPVLEASLCNIPNTAQAYSLNFTAVPHGALSYLTVWQTGQTQPLASTLNAPTGATTANAAIVPVGTDGAISAYASNDTDLVIDINGYFAPTGMPGQSTGLSYYPSVPCRVLDTRPPNGSGPFDGTLSPSVDMLGSPCGVPTQSQAYALNATAVPAGALGYLTVWPAGLERPGVSTLNASDGKVTSNLAIVPAGQSGEVDAFASGTTNLILDLSGFFAQ